MESMYIILYLKCILISLSSSAYDLVVNGVLSNAYDKRTSEKLISLIPMVDGMEDDCLFSRLHKIILGFINYPLEEELAAGGFDPDTTDSMGINALLWAVKRSDHSAIRLLLNAQADPNIGTETSRPPLFFAARTFDMIAIKLLLDAGAEIHHQDKNGQNALHNMLYGSAAAPKQVQLDTMRLLIAAGVEIDLQDCSGSTPLHQSTNKDTAAVLEALLDQGAGIDTADLKRYSPLANAIFHSSLRSTKLLLQRGADFTIVNHTGNTILHIAAHHSNLATLQVLVEASLTGIDPNAINDDGKTAMQLAEERLSKEPGFIDLFHALIFGINNQNDYAKRNKDMSVHAEEEKITKVPGAWPL